MPGAARPRPALAGPVRRRAQTAGPRSPSEPVQQGQGPFEDQRRRCPPRRRGRGPRRSRGSGQAPRPATPRRTTVRERVVERAAERAGPRLGELLGGHRAQGEAAVDELGWQVLGCGHPPRAHLVEAPPAAPTRPDRLDPPPRGRSSRPHGSGPRRPRRRLQGVLGRGAGAHARHTDPSRGMPANRDAAKRDAGQPGCRPAAARRGGQAAGTTNARRQASGPRSRYSTAKRPG